MSYPTWSDLNSPSIVPPLGARQAPDLGPAAVMVSTEPDVRYIRSNSGKLAARPFFTGTLMVDDHGGICIAGPYIGAPYGTMLLESLIAKGARQIIVLGWCGSLNGELAPGDLIIPDLAICDEGTSRHYAALDADLPVTRPDKRLSQKLGDLLKEKGEKAHRLPIWTTDAIYRETREKVEWYRNKGAAAVEMECSALFAAAQFRSIPLTALLVVSDSLAGDDWDPGFKKKQFKTMRRIACNTVVDLARNLAHDP